MSHLSVPEAAALRRQFRRCDATTIDAILAWRDARDHAAVPEIVHGILRVYLPEQTDAATQPILRPDGAVEPTARLDSLGMDSLTTLELFLDVQDALDVTISEEELRRLQTVADVQALLRMKTADPA